MRDQRHVSINKYCKYGTTVVTEHDICMQGMYIGGNCQILIKWCISE